MKPGSVLSIRKALIPPRARFSLSVKANTVATSATSPLVMKCLRPFSTQPVSVRSAVVLMFAASDPASGSLRAKQPVHSPLARRGRYFCFCFSVPSMRMPWEPIPVFVPTRDRKHALVLESSSYTRHSPSVPIPIPPYSSGIESPKRPSSRILSTIDSGILSSSSTCRLKGSRSCFTKRLTVSRINRRLSGTE